jgi:hypothetical protein
VQRLRIFPTLVPRYWHNGLVFWSIVYCCYGCLVLHTTITITHPFFVLSFTTRSPLSMAPPRQWNSIHHAPTHADSSMIPPLQQQHHHRHQQQQHRIRPFLLSFPLQDTVVNGIELGPYQEGRINVSRSEDQQYHLYYRIYNAPNSTESTTIINTTTDKFPKQGGVAVAAAPLVVLHGGP